jgi:hypothetical protein
MVPQLKLRNIIKAGTSLQVNSVKITEDNKTN